MLRFDMSEYMERHSVSRLIGAPPGYVGFDQGGLLTDGIDQHPHTVLLLDEIEKAHPDLFNILLQVMDHGKLTDHNGKSVDFRNVIVIMTTNAGAADLAKAAFGFNRAEREGDDMEAVRGAEAGCVRMRPCRAVSPSRFPSRPCRSTNTPTSSGPCPIWGTATSGPARPRTSTASRRWCSPRNGRRACASAVPASPYRRVARGSSR
jgi:hypothetical protein